MKIPTRKQCFELMNKYGMYDNIKRHSVAVEGVAVFLAEELNKKGVFVDVDLVSRAALMHDIGKVEELEGGDSHDEVGKRILKNEGLEELGILCAKHYFGRERGLKTWEEKLVSYADKRVVHDKIVSLEDRIEYDKKTYPRVFFGEAAEEQIKDSYELEREIFEKLDVGPEDVTGNFKF